MTPLSLAEYVRNRLRPLGRAQVILELIPQGRSDAVEALEVTVRLFPADPLLDTATAFARIKPDMLRHAEGDPLERDVNRLCEQIEELVERAKKL